MSLGQDETYKKQCLNIFFHLIYSRMQIINSCNKSFLVWLDVPYCTYHQYLWAIAWSEPRNFLLGPSNIKPLLKWILSKNLQHPKAFKSLYCSGFSQRHNTGDKMGVGFHHVILHKERTRYIGTVVQMAGTHPLYPLITVWGRHNGAGHDFHKGNLKGICNFQPATSSQSTCSQREKFKQYFLFLIHFCFIPLSLLQAQREQNKSTWLKILYNSENWLELDSKHLTPHFND